MPSPNRPIADAPDKNWVERFCPLWAQPYLRLSRIDRPIGTWLLLLPCCWGLALGNSHLSGQELLWYFCAFALGAILMRGAGCTWNDITDQKLDAQVARTRNRPLPARQLSNAQALLWLSIQLALSALILMQFNRFAIVTGLAALLPVALYPFAKRFTWWPQLFLGIAFNWGALLSWAALYGRIEWPAIYLYCGGIAWTLFYDTIYAHQDKEDDALIGIKSTARLFAHHSAAWLFLFAALAVVFLAMALSASTIGTDFALLLASAGILGFALHLLWQLRHLDITDAQNCLRLFRANRDAGLVVAIGFLLARVLA